MPCEGQKKCGKTAGNEDERAESEVSKIVFHGRVRGLDRPRRVIVTHIARAPFQRYFFCSCFFCSTMSGFSAETAASTSAFSFSGTLNLSSVATRCPAAVFQSASEIPIP